MATVPSINVTGPAQMPGIGFGQSVKSKTVKYEFTSAVASGTVITGPLIQAGSVVLDVLLVSNGGAAVNVGPTAEPARFIAGGTGAVQRSSAATARPYLMPINGTIDVTTTGAGGASGSYDLTVYFQPRNT